MADESTGEIRIMATLAEMREELSAEIKDVRKIATGVRAVESHEIELHGEKIGALETVTSVHDAIITSHAAQLKVHDLQMATLLREVNYSNSIAHRNEKKLNALLGKWGIEDPAADPSDTPKLTKPRPKP